MKNELWDVLSFRSRRTWRQTLGIVTPGLGFCCALTCCAINFLYAYPAVPLFFCALRIPSFFFLFFSFFLRTYFTTHLE